MMRSSLSWKVDVKIKIQIQIEDEIDLCVTRCVSSISLLH